MVDSQEPVSPLSLRGFKLHTICTQPPGENMVHHITFPHLLGELTSTLLVYGAENFPRDLMQSPKMGINLHPPAKDHWNVISDSVFPSRLEESRQQWEAKELVQVQEKESKEAEVSHPQETADRAPPAAPVIGCSPERLLPAGSRS